MRTIRIQFSVYPEYIEKFKSLNTDPFDSNSVFLMKLIDEQVRLKNSQSIQEDLSSDVDFPLFRDEWEKSSLYPLDGHFLYCV